MESRTLWLFNGLKGQSDRAEQSGRKQRSVFRELADVRAGKPFLFGQLKIADQAIGPKVDNLHLEGIHPAFDMPGHIFFERSIPPDTGRMTVYRHFGNMLYFAERKDHPVSSSLLRRQCKTILIHGGAGVVTDAFVGMMRP